MIVLSAYAHPAPSSLTRKSRMLVSSSLFCASISAYVELEVIISLIIIRMLLDE